MQTLFLDFETYYSSKDKMSLRGKTYREYCLDPRFQTIGVSYVGNTGDPTWVPGPQVRDFIESVDWSQTVMSAHNCPFDASVLHYVYGKHPAHLVCTMALATVCGLRMHQGGSLDALVKALIAAGYDLPHKGTEVVMADGKRYEDFTPEELAAYAHYCDTDVILCRAAAQIMLPMVPMQELQYQSMMMKCGTDPILRVDAPLLEQELIRIKTLKDATLNKAAEQFGATPIQLNAILQSNIQFVNLLESIGCEVPMKVSKATGKEAPALAKSDEGFLALLEHDDERVQALVAARLGNKSTDSENKTQRMIDMAGAELPIYYNISGAHTHRLSATQGFNAMALPSGRVKGTSNACRRAMMAPEGFVVGSVDSGAVEVRIMSYIANEYVMLDAYKGGMDVYTDMAASMYDKPYDDLVRLRKEGDIQAGLDRQVGKSAILGSGFGSGPAGFHNYARSVAKLDMSMDEAAVIVTAFRRKYPAIPAMWKKCGEVLKDMIRGGQGYFGGPNDDLFYYDGSREVLGMQIPGIRLPDGLWLNYLGLREAPGEIDELTGERGYPQILYDQMKGRNRVPTKIYTSRLFENLVQATAFAVLKLQMLEINKRYRVVANVHDEAVCLIPQSEDPEVAKAFMIECFTKVPAWLEGCPLTGEAGVALRYGDC